MRSLLAFTKKEWMEQLRSGRLMILGILFILLGIMNPALAKLIPWMLEAFADSLAESGMAVTAVTVDALTSWTQFFKNIPMGLIAFILLQSNIFTREYQSGTLVLSLTKGLDRHKVVISKTVVLAVLWSALYLLCFAVTYGYNAFFWDNGIARNLAFSAVCWWLLGLWTVMLTVLFSSVLKSSTGVLAGTAGVFLAAYLIGLLPKIKTYSPSMLANASTLLYSTGSVSSYTASITVTVFLCLICFLSSIPILNKKQI